MAKKFVITYSKKNLCYVRWGIDSGSSEDIIPGTAHFLEHLIACSYTPEEKEFEKKLFRRGIIGNAWTNYLETRYFYPSFYYDKEILEAIIKTYGKTLRTYLNEGEKDKENSGIAILNKRAKKEVEIIKAEIARSRTLGSRAGDAVIQTLRQKGCNLNTIGTIEDVDSLRGRHFQSYMKKYYNKSNAYFIIGLPETEKKNEKYWVNLINNEFWNILPNGKNYSRYIPYEFEDGLIYPSETDNATVIFNTDLNPLYGQLEEILFRHMFRFVCSNVIFDKIRYRENLAYDPGCWHNQETSPGCFYIDADIDKKHWTKFISIVEHMLDNFRFTEEDINGWKLFMKEVLEKDHISARRLLQDIVDRYANKDWKPEYYNMPDERFYELFEKAFTNITLVTANKWYSYVYPQIEKTLQVTCGEKSSNEKIMEFIESTEKFMRDQAETAKSKTKEKPKTNNKKKVNTKAKNVKPKKA